MRISLLASKSGSSGKPLKTKFEAEFLPLAAFATIKDSQSQAEKDRELDAFVDLCIGAAAPSRLSL